VVPADQAMNLILQRVHSIHSGAINPHNGLMLSVGWGDGKSLPERIRHLKCEPFEGHGK
jgi:hypothetical protein